ncbi:hypothetical protein LIA77_09868 [Sarocladium implicatum]|nr:hypothetical protein LIA77_09868 [Sarocladium implicatum]
MPAEATKSARAVLPRRMLPSLLPPTHTTGSGASHVSQRGNGPPRHRQPHTLSLCPTGNLIPVIRRAPAPLLHPSLPFDDLMARVPWARVSAKGVPVFCHGRKGCILRIPRLWVSQRCGRIIGDDLVPRRWPWPVSWSR